MTDKIITLCLTSRVHADAVDQAILEGKAKSRAELIRSRTYPKRLRRAPSFYGLRCRGS
jgi:hypothetical protein